jgi:transposase-like protein
MSTRQRRHFSDEQKAAIIKRHLVDKVSVSDLCDELKILPTQFYQWQKQLFENGAAAFARNGQSKRSDDAKDRKIAQLEAKLAQKNEVVAELLEDHVRLKKELGDL